MQRHYTHYRGIAHPLPHLRPRLLSTALALAVCTPIHAFAQEAGNAATLDAVQVTGVRSSLQKSQIIKQDFIGTVDAVSAEDVGKFPDQNVADALQRVPGVSVDRSGGESRYITVRGFGPEFNTVLLNGRTMATEVAGREFSFDILPSELISAAEVQKTSTADSTEGSIGATINIRTQRPLDNRGLHVSAAVAGVYDSMSKDTKPKVSGLISHTNADGTLGGLLSVVHYQRSHRGERASTSGWLTGGLGYNGIALPRTVDYQVVQEERTRRGINAAFDWHPSATIKLGMDAMYSRYKIDRIGNAASFFTVPGDIIDIEADENGTATWFRRGDTGILTTGHIQFSETGAVGTPLAERDSTNKQLGAHLDWQVGERTTLAFDGSWSKADNTPDPRKGYYISINRPHFGVNPQWHLNPGAFPSYTNLLPATDAAYLQSGYSRRRGRLTSDQLREFKTHLTHSFYDGTLSRVQFGVSGSTRTKDNHTIRTLSSLDNAYSGVTEGLARIPAEFTQIFNAGNVAGAGGPTQWLGFDPDQYHAWLTTEAAWGQFAPGGIAYTLQDPNHLQRVLDALAQHNGGFNPIASPLDDWKVREKNAAAFAQADFEGDWGTMPWKLNVGVRYIRTDLTSQALSVQVDSITLIGDPPIAFVNFTQPLLLSKRSRYHDWLPSFNFRLNLRDDVLLRLSASETLTRPTLTNLRASETITVQPPSPGARNTGNADLKPYTSKNVDLGLEWYMNDTSYIALAGFYKNVSNFVATITVPTTILDYTFMHTMPVNAETAIIKGAELSFQYTFDRLPAPFDGFGVQLNYTWVDSQQSFDPAIASGQFAVVGLSDSGNLVLFYEKDRFGIRAAYNWRDEYLAAVRGDQGEPSTVNTYQQIDLSTHFKLTDTISIFADATNLTGETESAWQRYRNRVHWMADNGRTVTLGIRGVW